MFKAEYLVAISLFTGGWVVGAYGVDMLVYIQSINHALIASLLTILGSVATVVGIGFAYSQWRRSRIDDIQSRLAQIAVDRVRNMFDYICFQADLPAVVEISKRRFRITDAVLGHQGTLYVKKLVKLNKSDNAKNIYSLWAQSFYVNEEFGNDEALSISKIMNEVTEKLRDI